MTDPQSPNHPAQQPHNVAGDYVAGDKPDGDKVMGNKSNFNNPAPNQGAQGTFNKTVNVNHYYGAPPPELPPLPPVDSQAARAKLAELPTAPNDPIPPAAALPPGSRMQFARNHIFTGRELELHLLARSLKTSDANVICTGIGGVGKTSLAIEFARCYGQYFLGGVFWLNCAEAENMPSEVVACGGYHGMRLPGFAALTGNVDEQIALVLAEWAQETPRLLIFDNCEHPALLTQYRPGGGGCRVLVTSRNQVWPATLYTAMLPLDVLTPEESVELLRALCDPLNDDEATQVSDALGRLPLALHLAGSYLQRYRTPVEDYLTVLASQKLLDEASLIGRGVQDNPTGRVMHVAKAFTLSFDQLQSGEPIDEVARLLLARASCLAPGEPFPQALLEATLPVDDKSAAHDRTDGLNRLLELGLIERDGEQALKLHLLLVAFVQSRLQVEEARPGVETAIIKESMKINENGNPFAMIPIISHVKCIISNTINQPNTLTATLANNYGFYLREIGDYQSAKYYIEKALIIHNDFSPNNFEDTMTILCNLGLVYLAQLKYDEAQPYLKRALDICEQTLDKENAQVAKVLYYYGDLLQETEKTKYDAALIYYKRALTIFQKQLGEENPETAVCMNKIGDLLYRQGDKLAAKEYLATALSVLKKNLPINHPYIATCLNSLGYVLYESGDQNSSDYNIAKTYFEEALAIFKQKPDLHHANTVKVLINLGHLLHSNGNFSDAQQYLEQALDIHEEEFGVNSLITTTVLNDLGILMQNKGDYEQAQIYFQHALDIRLNILGLDHLDTAASQNYLGVLFQIQSKYDSAQTCFEQELAIYEKKYATDDLNIATILNNLAVVIAYQGDFTRAIPLMERSCAISQEKLGDGNLDTQRRKASLAAMRQQAKGRFDILAAFTPLLEMIAAIARGDAEFAQDDIDRTLTDIKQSAHSLREAAHAIWQGERDIASLTTGLGVTDTALVRRVMDYIAENREDGAYNFDD